MSNNLKNLLRDSLLNNTYDYKVLHETLNDTWTNSYSYLYQLQKSYIEYEEHTYISNDIVSRDVTNIGHLYLDKAQNACFDIDYDFIHVSNREEFKRSKFYNKKFSFTDMHNNPKIFNKIPIILVDGRAIWDYKLLANNGKFTVILPFKKKFVISVFRNLETNDNVYLDHKIKVLIVDNVLYERVTLNKNHILNTTNKTLTVNTSLLKEKTNKEGIYFMSVHIPNIFGENYELGTNLMPCTYDGNSLTCTLSPEDYTRISKHTRNLYISIVFVNQLHLHTFYTGNPFTTCVNNECNLFILQRDECVPYAMPIPVEHLMVIRKREGVLEYINNLDAVEMYYPNIYHIIDPDRADGDEYYIYYFYKYADSLKYTPLFDFYYDFLKIKFKGRSIEHIVDKLFKGDFLVTDGDGEDIPLEDVEKLFLNSGNSTNKPLAKYYIKTGDSSLKDIVEYILNCGDSRTAPEDEFLIAFYRVIQYGYYKHAYGDIDFVKRYLLEEGNSDKDPLEYKDETIRDWICEDPKVLRDYVINQNKLSNPVYHLWTDSINLSKRLRTSTVPEMGASGSSLPEECYVFSFRNDDTTSGKLLNIRVFVDGLFVVNMTQVRHLYTDYLYIPKSLVTDHSYIEVEIFPSYEYNTILNFTSIDDIKEIELLEPVDSIYPTAEDVYYIAPYGHIYDSLVKNTGINTPSTGGDTIIENNDGATTMTVDGVEYTQTKIYDNKSFEITSRYDEGDYVVKTTDEDKPVRLTRLKKISIKPISEEVINTDIVFCISKVPLGLELTIEKDEYPYVSLVGNNFKFSHEYIRVYKNGRLVPKNNYVYLTTYSFPRIAFLEEFNEGDTVYIDITPYRYKNIYYQEEIQEGQNLIDLNGYIDKPFDIRYYDVYLNGRKLSLNNVISISPWLISLVNIKSIYNLQIFEKERDYEFYGTEFKINKYYYTIDDLLYSSFITNEEKSELINKIINDDKDENLILVPNENSEEKRHINSESDVDRMEMYLFYAHELIPQTYVNPDKKQVYDKSIETSMNAVHRKFYTLPSESSRNDKEYQRRQNYDPVYILDPDRFISDGSISGESESSVYSIGHLDDVSESILSQPVNDMNE